MTLRRRLRSSGATVRHYLDLLRYGDRPLRLDEPPAARCVVVLAPHADDETLGCGGTIRLYRDAGVPVTAIVLADGDDASIRRAEAARATAALGVDDLVFLGLRDGGIDSSSQSVQALRERLVSLKPDVVFLPFVTDQHTDHVATNRLFIDACAGANDLRPACWGYEVWTPLYANRLVDISAVAEAKWTAIRHYESQQSRLDYLRAIQALNAFRQHTMYRRDGFAEAFFACAFDQYCEIVARLAS